MAQVNNPLSPTPTNDPNVTLANHPQSIQQPALANDALNSQNQDGSMTTIMHSLNQSSLQQGLQDHIAANPGSESFWQKHFGGALKAVSTGLAWLNKPLQEIQKDYKFIHSVWVRHGAIQGIMAAAGVAGGAAAGSILGPEGMVAGADLAASGERGLASLFGNTWRDSLNDANNQNYQVSAGRDFANAVAHVPGLGDLKNTDTGTGKIISGLGDAIFDFNFDPLVAGTKLKSSIQQGKFLTTEAGKLITTFKIPFRSMQAGVADFLGRNSLRVFSPDQLDSLYQAGKNPTLLDRAVGGAGTRYVRALDNILDIIKNADNKTTAEMDIVQQFPGLQGIVSHLVRPIANITRDDLHNVFLQTTYDSELMRNFSVNGAAMVPNRTVIRAALSDAADKLRQWDTNNPDIYLRTNQANFFVPRLKAPVATINEKGEVATTGEVQNVMPVIFRPWDAEAWKSAIAGKYRTFSGYVPYTIDSKTLELSNTKFDPNDPASALPVYRIARFSMSDQLAKQKATEFINGTIAQKKDIYSALVNEMFKAAGLPNDPELAAKIMDKSAQLAHGPLDKVNYGPGYLGGDNASIATFDGHSTPQGMFEDQRGYFSMPDFRAVKGAMRSMGAYGKLYGKLDDFAARYTDGIFKPLALLTGGFGLRIAASEMLPAVFRFGTMDIARAKVAGAAQKMNYKLAAGEDDAIIENAIHAVSDGTDPVKYLADAAAAVEGKVVRKTVAKGLAKLASEEDLDLAARIAIATKGHMASGATHTGYGATHEQQEWLRTFIDIMGQDAKRRYAVPTNQYSSFNSSDPHFHLHYFTELSKSAVTTSRKQIVSDALAELKRGATPDEAWEIARLKDEARIRQLEFNPDNPAIFGNPTKNDPYASERKVMAGYVNEDPQAFSARRVDAMRNLFTGRTGEEPLTGMATQNINRKLMQQIANGIKPTLDQVKAIPDELRPWKVAGQRYEIMPGPNLTQRITNFGFEKVVDPLINNLSRQPLFFNHVKNEMRSLQYAVDNGIIDEAQATRLAMTRATYSMIPQIHNTALRTQFSVLARNYLPFYFAQEQAMRRAGSLILTNPAAFRQYQLIEHSINNPAFVETDANGQKNITIPGIGELGAGFMNAAARIGLPVVGGLPVNITGNLQSLKTVFPEFTVPGVSPFVSVAANAVAAFDPTMQRAINKITGGYSTALFDQLMPNSVARTLYHAINAKETESSYYNAIIASLTSAQFHGQIPGPDASPFEMQAFIDRIKNNAKSVMIMKALVGAISPVAPAVSQEDRGLRNEFYKILKQTSPVTGKPMTYPEALQIFLKEHGSSAISYTISRSEAGVKGATMPYTDAAINWIESNQNLLYGKQAVGAAFLVPQITSGSGDAQAVHDEIIKMHLRANKTPQDFLNSYYVAAGNNYIAEQRVGHDAEMKRLQDAGLSTKAERDSWNAYVTEYGKANPLWWNDYSSTERNHVAQVAMQDFGQLFAGKSLAQIKSQYGEQAGLVAQLYNDWTGHNAEMQRLRLSSYGTGAVTVEKDNWINYTKSIAQQYPQLNTVVNSVFARVG